MPERVLLLGATGLAGSAIGRAVPHVSSRGFDLRVQSAAEALIDAHRPACIILAAARVGGLFRNAAQQADQCLENLAIETNVLRAARAAAVPRLIFLASSCAYPRTAAQPMREELLGTGPVEPTNYGYAAAKLAGIAAVRAVREQDGADWCSVLPSNLYGPGDNYDESRSHVVAALIRRLHRAARRGEERVVLRGSGAARRDFLYSDDLGAAIACLLRQPRLPWAEVNIGTDWDNSVRALAMAIGAMVQYQGEIEWDTSAPDGAPRKLLDVSRMHSLGWRALMPLYEGLERAIKDFEERYPDE